MNKFSISLFGSIAAILYTQDVFALPAFARQTGMACFTCHQQHFPVLNSFGRAFKASGYTLTGSQPLIEDERLSLPSTMNAAILLKLRYQQDNTTGVGSKSTGSANGLGDGQLQFGDEFSLFMSGRVSHNIGFMLEGSNAAPGSLLAGFKLPVSLDTNVARLSIIPFTTDVLGVQYGYELSSGGVMRANRWAEHRRETSAIQYNADQGVDAGAATGFAFVAKSDNGFINISKWSPSFAMGANGGTYKTFDLNSLYVRIAATPTIGDWAIVVGGGQMGGTSLTSKPDDPAATPATLISTRQAFVDFQAHGQVQGKDLSIYSQYATAPATTTGNSYNNAAIGNPDRHALTIGLDYSLIPKTLSVGTAYRYAKNGKDISINGDNAVTLTVEYGLAQNVGLHLNHSQYSGSAHNAAGSQRHLTTFMLEAAW